MSKSYILSIDQGTSGTKAIIFDEFGTVIIKTIEPLKSYYPTPSFVEQDPQEIYESVIKAVKNCIKKFNDSFPEEKHKIVSCGISNQRETFVLWDKNGKPLHNAVVWQCKRSVEVCERLKENNLEENIQTSTGLTIDPYFSATKVIWLYENNATVKKAIDKGEAYFGTVDTWLLYKLTNGSVFKTEYTNASRTLFYNIYNLEWDASLLKAFNIDSLNLPEVTFSSDYFGDSTFENTLSIALPITGIIGDSQAAFFGEECFTNGMAKATLGTGSSILWNAKNLNKITDNGMLTTIGWSLEGQVNYALEGVIVSCGSTIEWLKNQLAIFTSYDQIEPMATFLETNEDVYLVPAFSGMGAPYWQKEWKASIHGLTFGTTKEHLVRAALESIAFQLKDVIFSIEKETKTQLKELKVNGGITANKFLMQFIADLLKTPITNMGITDVSAWGAALISGLGVKLWTNIDEIPKLPADKIKKYQPNLNSENIDNSYLNWVSILKNKIA
ncbi:carbohydrate kinase [Polaribacter vadi]|uniref:glycerol kinase n=1 Tax=Polaribacter vadi TaxID=1774273 RepID=A0A1B8TSD1_9FLAO|nr:glycerol kinase GlpK [Polaribacter vadi]AOW17866.1 carbohydrate kinase [Polaribacter vadi]OBY62591.1 carbohydrate kinase [Polaribacter vadi]